MVLNATPEEQAQYRELNRIRMKTYRDKSRKRKYSPRLDHRFSYVQTNKEEKQ